MISVSLTIVCLGFAVLSMTIFLNFFYLLYDLFPNWRQLGGIKFLLLLQSLLCMSVLVCLGCLPLVEREPFMQTFEAGLTWFSTWLQAATLYNLAAIVFILYLRQKQGGDYSTRKVLMGTLVVVFLVPLTPLVPLVYYLKGVICAERANWKSPFNVQCWWPQANKDAILAPLSWILLLLYAVPAILSLVCITSLVFNRYKNKLPSRFVIPNGVTPCRKFVHTMALCLAIATLVVLSVLSAVPGSITWFGVKTSLEKENYYELLRVIWKLATCIVFAACSVIPVMLGFLVEETKNDNRFDDSIHVFLQERISNKVDNGF